MCIRDRNRNTPHLYESDSTKLIWKRYSFKVDKVLKTLVGILSHFYNYEVFWYNRNLVFYEFYELQVVLNFKSIATIYSYGFFK